MTNTEALELVKSCLPPGSEQAYDFASTANIGKMLIIEATRLKTYGFDYIDTLRAENNPSTCTLKIPDWEAALGLTNTPIARFGTTAQRRNAILAWMRQAGTFSIADIQAAMQPFFLYADPSQIQILEASRTSLQTAHTYAFTTGVTGPNTATSWTAQVPDDPRVSPAGAMVTITIAGTLDQLSFFVTSPSGVSTGFGRGWLGFGVQIATTYYLYCPNQAGNSINGTWTLQINTGAAATVYSAGSVFVEGLGVNYDSATPPARNGDGLGGKMFEFAVVADPALLGTGYDLVGALRSLRRIQPAHTMGYIAVRPTLGGLPMIYDDPNAIYDAGVFG